VVHYEAMLQGDVTADKTQLYKMEERIKFLFLAPQNQYDAA
jgi:hypothetical protein